MKLFVLASCLLLSSCVSLESDSKLKLDQAHEEIKRLNKNLEDYRGDFKRVADAFEKLAKRFDDAVKFLEKTNE